MDAVEYVKTKYRLCRSKDSCFECPLQDKENCGCITDTIEYVEKAVQIVEEWAKDHPSECGSIQKTDGASLPNG